MTDQEQQHSLGDTSQKDDPSPEVEEPKRVQRKKRGHKFAAEIPKRSSRIHKSVEKFSNKPMAKWSLVEKTKLLEGIRRFSTDNTEILASMVKTRTQDEIVQYIKELKTIQNKRKSALEQETMADKKSPIELWTELVAEMVFYEDKDYSQLISKVFGLIARNEKFAASQVPRLSWKRIYQFISDLLNDKAELSELTDVESHVILDMMQGLGDTLRSSDTHIQQRLVNMKYKLLNTKQDRSQESRQNRVKQIYRGLTNNFEYLDDGDKSSGTSRGTVSDSSRPSTASSSSEKLSSASASSSSCETAHCSGTSNMAMPSKYADLNELLLENETLESRPKPSETVSTDEERQDMSCNDEIDMSKPKLFTLNPLCIPTTLLPLKRKGTFL